MTSLDRFNEFAAARGEGLHPKISDLLERTAVSPSFAVTVRQDRMLQAGPNPNSEMGVSHGSVASLGIQNGLANSTRSGDAAAPQVVQGVPFSEPTKTTT
jgi:hypothetical protein